MTFNPYEAWEPRFEADTRLSSGVSSIFCDDPPEEMPPCRPVGFVR